MDTVHGKRRADHSANRVLLLATCLGVVLAVVYVSRWVTMASRHEFDPVDFYAFYTAASIVRDGHADRLYDFVLQSHYELQLLGELPLNGNVLPFISPPHLALALLPFSLLPLQSALQLWLGLQALLACVLFAGCLTADSRTSWPERILLLAALVSCPMLAVTLYKGQVTLIALIAILLWIRAMRAGKDAAIAGWLLIGTIKPQLIIVPLLVVVLARRWKALGIFVVGVSAIATACMAALGTSCLPDFVATIRVIDATFDNRIVYPWYMYNFKGFMALLLGLGQPQLLRALTHVGLIGALCATVGLWRGRVDPWDEGFELKLALSLLLGLFFNSHVYAYDALMLVAVGALFHQFLHRSGYVRMRWLFLSISLASAPLFLESGWFIVAHRVVRWPIVLMLAWMSWMLVLLVRRQGETGLSGRF